MCYTPQVSLATALIEWILVVLMVKTFKKTLLRDYFAVLIVLLGVYQFTEFMLCTSGYAKFWATLGFVTYTFLPAICLDAVTRFLGKRVHPAIIYAIPVLASAFTVFSGAFVTEAYCSLFYIRVLNMFNQAQGGYLRVASLVYSAYYSGFIVLSGIMMLSARRKESDHRKKRLHLCVPVGILMMGIPTYLVMFVLSDTVYTFPSVLCHFALFFAMMAFLAVYYESAAMEG